MRFPAAPAVFGPLEAPQEMDARIAAALRASFKKVDEELLFRAEMKDGDRSGTTAVVALNIDNVSVASIYMI
jgi:hypothetical protein